MPVTLIDENNIRQLPPLERYDECWNRLQHNEDESVRWDAVWLLGEIIEQTKDKDLIAKVADAFEYVCKNDSNAVVVHEASYQIAARDLRDKIPVLIDVSLNHPRILAKHEAIEALGLMRAFEVEDDIAKLKDDPNPDVRETARFVLKRFSRQKLSDKKDDYAPGNIL
jgi:HEAT repeat protein